MLSIVLSYLRRGSRVINYALAYLSCMNASDLSCINVKEVHVLKVVTTCQSCGEVQEVFQ